jgi:hypothetical protein
MSWLLNGTDEITLPVYFGLIAVTEVDVYISPEELILGFDFTLIEGYYIIKPQIKDIIGF